MPRWVVWAAVVALAGHASLVAWTAHHASATLDETGHLPSGLSYIEQGTFEVNPQPPLLKMLGAAAALAAGARGHYDGEWRAAREAGGDIHYPALMMDFAEAYRDSPGRFHQFLRAARLVVLPFSLLLGGILFFWGRDLFGPEGGLLALVLWCFSPHAIAHASLFTSDVPAAALIMAATYAFWRWLPRPSIAGALGIGALLGLAQLVKFTALILYALWPLLALFALLRVPAPGSGLPATRGGRLRVLGARGILVVATSLLVLNAGYGFDGSGHRLGDPDYLSPVLAKLRHPSEDTHPRHVYSGVYAIRVNRFRDTPLGALPVPLPRLYMVGFDLQAFEARPGLPGAGWTTYLRGEVRRGGWWYYYLYALGVKSTPSVAILLGAALLALAVAPSSRLDPADELFIWVPPLAMLGGMIQTEVDLGVRYAIPSVPFLLLATGRLAPLALRAKGRALRGLVALAALLHVASAVWIAPHALAYFSPLVGGADRGHRHLAGSNLDWGQELLHLQRWLAEEGAEGPVSAALYTNLDPGVIGLDVGMIPRDPRVLRRTPGAQRAPGEPARLTPGRYVVSANYLVGLPFRLVREEGVVAVPENAYAYFDRLEPVARIGHVLWVYDLDAEGAERLNRAAGFPRLRSSTGERAPTR